MTARGASESTPLLYETKTIGSDNTFEVRNCYEKLKHELETFIVAAKPKGGCFWSGKYDEQFDYLAHLIKNLENGRIVLMPEHIIYQIPVFTSNNDNPAKIRAGFAQLQHGVASTNEVQIQRQAQVLAIAILGLKQYMEDKKDNKFPALIQQVIDSNPNIFSQDLLGSNRENITGAVYCYENFSSDLEGVLWPQRLRHEGIDKHNKLCDWFKDVKYPTPAQAADEKLEPAQNVPR